MKCAESMNVSFLDRGDPSDWLMAAHTLFRMMVEKHGAMAKYTLRAERHGEAVMFVGVINEA